MKEYISMSSKEVDRISILDRLKGKEIKQKKAAELLNISVRQVRRILRVYKMEGSKGLVHHLRGKKSHRCVNQDTMDRACTIVAQKYADFTVTLAHEKLVEVHQFPYGRETLRQGLINAGLWHPKRQKQPVIHQMRERRSCEGELVQIDGSPHAWFEDRGQECTLLVYIDDATGKLLWLMFVHSESTNAYFRATRGYLLTQGKPVAFYSDKHGVFRVNTTKYLSASVDDSNGLTQFGRAMQELGIEMIFANTPQAKGRVEKVNQTLQDRLVKEMRLRNISTMEDGNAYLPEFMNDFNKRFAVTPKSPINVHRPVADHTLLDNILVQKYTRIVSKNLSISYGNKTYQIRTNHPTYALRHARVLVLEDQEGTVRILYGKEQVSYQVLAIQPKSEIVDTKHLNQKVDHAKDRVWTKPASTHPWKRPFLYW